MESKAITNAQITASSQFGDPGHDPWKARLNLVDYRGSWVAGVYKQGEYVQVDFGVTKMISKVAIQGRGKYEQYVTKISLKYSADGSQWFDYKDSKYIK
ncbi:Lactadherin, partial [Exaiptasia diaphana]